MFTPGPWRVITGTHSENTEMHDEGETWFNVNNEDGVIADVLHGRCLDVDEDEAAANARLIAEAPTMYELLVEIFEEVGLPEPQLSKYQQLLNRIQP